MNDTWYEIIPPMCDMQDLVNRLVGLTSRNWWDWWSLWRTNRRHTCSGDPLVWERPVTVRCHGELLSAVCRVECIGDDGKVEIDVAHAAVETHAAAAASLEGFEQRMPFYEWEKTVHCVRFGDQLFDLPALMRSAGVFAGLTTGPVAAGLSGWVWWCCVLAAIAFALLGWVVAAGMGRVIFPPGPHDTAIKHVGSVALQIALLTSLAGGLVVTAVGSFAALVGADGVAAAITGLAGLGASIAVWALAAGRPES